MEKLLLSLSNYLRDIKKMHFAVLFLLSLSGFAQSITTNKTVTANATNCGIVNVKVDITGANPITRNSDVILAIDVSGSMGNTISGDFKTSMDYAKDAAKAFLTQAKANPQNRIAIVAYSTTASLKIGLTYLNAAGVTLITNQINALQATNSTNIYAGIVRSETELETNGRFDCSTARAIILLTDGVTNVTGTSGNTNCSVSKTSQCVTDAINAATNAKTTTKSSVVYNNQVFSVGLFGGISGNINTNNSDQNIAKFTLDGIQGSPASITQSGANLTAIYNQIATQISWVAQNLITKETIIPGFTIASITTSKGTASLSGQVITWNTDFLNSETITLNYQLTPTGTACGTQTVSTSTLNYQNSTCANDSKAISSPGYFVPCAPVITGVLTACGSTTLTATTNAASPTYVWYKDGNVISGQTAATLVVTVSGAYKVKVKNGATNCELTSAESTVSISPAAALTAPANANIAGCGTYAITGLAYNTASTNITLAQLTTEGGTLPNNASIGTYTISYSDVASGTCPTIVIRTFKVATSCGNSTSVQTITITDTTAPTWTTSATSLNTTLQCSDSAGLTTAQNQAPVATDNCGGTISYTKTSGNFTAGSCANSGTYTNTWIAKDVCLNTSTIFTQVISIVDNTAPTWTTSATALNITLQCSDSVGLTTAQNQAPVATDNCGGIVIYTKTSGNFVAGSCANSGTYTNTWIAKDVCLNTSTMFTQVISIIDNTAPTWTTSATALNTTLQCSDSAGLATAQNQAPVATDNCGGTVTYTKTSGNFTAGSCANSGTYTNTWIAKDVCLNTSTIFTQVISIIDNTAPTWTTSATALNTTLQCSDSAGLTTAQNQAPVATDNCGGIVTYTKTSGNFTAGSCANSGTYTNTWIAKDVCSNTSTIFTQVITIQDITSPTWTTSATALNTTLQCSDSAGLTTAQNQAPIATDNCGGTISYTKTSGNFVSGSCANSGTYTNTWIAKDVCLNTSTMFTQVITVQDTAIPTWITQAGSLNITLQCSDTTGLTVAQNQAPTASANCSIVTYIKTTGQFVSSLSCANSGTYTNTWIAKDDCGNTSDTFTQIITIQDTSAPTWSTPVSSLNKTIECSDALALISAQALFPVASDLCDNDVYNIIKVSGGFVASADCSNAGIYTNTWTVKDDCGNTSDTFTQVISIEDTSAPTWSTPVSSLNKTIECSDALALTSAQALFPVSSDLCDSDVSNIVKVSGVFVASADCSNAGTYTNTWTVKDDCGNTSDTFSQIITIQDTSAPTWLTPISSLNKTIECSDALALTYAQALFPVASDLCDSDVSNIVKVSGVFVASADCSNAGTYTNTWTVKDDCGNTSDTFTQVITIQDISAPTWSTPVSSLNKTIECSDALALTSTQALFPVASDLCDSDVSNIVKVSGVFVASADCSNAGTYTNTWTVKDDCGNTSDTFTQVITIQDISAPTWSTPVSSLNKTIECSDALALTYAQALFPVASDLCDSDVSNIVKVSGVFVASADCANAGTYTNTWTVKDDCGNTSDIFTQVITIQDTSAPTWSTPVSSLNKTIECSDALALTSAQALFPVSSDLCDSDVSNIVKVSGVFVASANCSNAGTYTNTWTVKDDCGNTSDTFTQVITIQDTSAPTWSTPVSSLNKTIECSDASALTSAQALFPVASDLCDSDVSNIVKVSGVFVASADCANAGTYTNTWTVKDDCGNTSDTFTQIITLEDTTKPIFIGDLPADSIVSCDAVPEPANVEVSDNCNGNLPIVFSQIKSNIVNECATNYTLTRTWRTSDCGRNTASYTQIITVRDTTPPTGTAPADVTNLQTIADIPVGNVSDIINPVDNCSATVNITVSDANNGGTGCDGNAYILTRTYTLTDCAGNKTELKQTFTVENKVSVTGIATNATCFGGKDGSILVTNSAGSTVVITNENNEVVGNSNLTAGTYTLTATSAVNIGNQTCSAIATVVIAQPTYTVKISGQIINKDTNTPIANVPVTLIPQGATTGPILLRITGADGFYNFSGMPAGSYLVQVQDANLNSVYQLYPVDSSLFFTILEDCKIQQHNFEYGASTLPVLGDYVWYDTNGNGIQDEWYDANNDGIVTKNIPDGNGAVDYSQWEWIDLNGDGSYKGPLNVGELNAGGFGNALSPNVIIDGPNGYHQEVIVGIEGFWRNRPNTANPYGDYTIKLIKDANLDAVAAALGASGLVKVVPSTTDKKVTKTGKSQLHTVCSITGGASGYIVTITPEDLVHLNADFGVNCKVYSDIVANDDSAGPIASVNHITPNVLNVLNNDTLEGVVVKASDLIITTVTPNEFLQLNPDGSVAILPNAPVGTLTLVYQICEADKTSNCDTATVTVIISASIPPIIANDDTYNNIGCNTFGLVGNVLINDFKGETKASLELVNFTLLSSDIGTKTDPNITFDTSGNATVSALTPVGTYTYSYQICDKLNADNCDTANVTIIVIPNSATNISSTACNDDSTLIDLLSLLPENTPTTGIWIDPNNSNTIQGNTFNALGLALGNYTFEYKITNQTCPRSILLTMTINNDCKVLACGNVIVHNAFSPNGDGINDVFKIESIDDITCYPENNVEIYNRWGILVFETENYNNITNAFDGVSRGRTTVKQSDGLPTGTYFYIINYKSLDGNNVLQNNKKDGYLYLSK